MENSNFDILDYLNNIYMHKMGNEIDVLKAGGHYNIHSNDDENKTQEEMLEINKKHIDIPNTQIRFFSYRPQGDIEQHNETKDDTKPIDESNSGRKRRDEVSSETEQQERIGGILSQEIIEI